MIHPLSPATPRFQGLKLQKNGCNWLGEYTPQDNRVYLDNNLVGNLQNPDRDFGRFMEYYAKSLSSGATQRDRATHSMKRHLQKRLAEVVDNEAGKEVVKKKAHQDVNEEMLNEVENFKRLPDFLHNLALFEQYDVYVQNIQVDPKGPKVTFRFGYPNCAAPAKATSTALSPKSDESPLK